MKEKNKHILSEALEKLPEHEPKDSLWNFIEDDLNHSHSNQRLKEGLQALPVYDPPESVWNQIDSELIKSQNSEARIIKMGNRRRLFSIAAAVAVLMAAGWWIFGLNGGENTDSALAFSTEILDDNLMKQDWNDDEGAFDELMTLCKVKIATCQNPEFVRLQSELDELNDAKEALNQAIGKFGTNANLISQIKTLELERTEIMKEMIEKLI